MLDTATRGRIACKVVEKFIRDKGMVTLKKNDFKREMTNLANAIDEKPADVEEFYKELVYRVMNECFQ